MFLCYRKYLILLSATFLLLNACSSDDNTSIQPTLTSLWNNHFSDCATNCHYDGASNGTENGPYYTTPQLFRTNLLGKVPADYPGWLRTGGCDTVPFITANNAAASLLAAAMIESISTALQNSEGVGCSTAYNLHLALNFTMTGELSQALIDWIDNGAQDN